MQPDPRPLRRLVTSAFVFLALLGTATLAHAEDAKSEVPAPSKKDATKPAIPAAPAKKPILYVAVGPDATLFLQGTLHVPDTRITTLTPAENAALDAADELWTEVDFSQNLAAQMYPYVRLPKNRPLDTLLDDKLKARIEAILKRHGQSLTRWQSQKPWMLDVSIGLLYAPRETATQKTIDEVLFAAMQARGKPAGGLETVYEQVGVFDRLSLKEQVTLLNDTVTRLESDHAKGTNSIEAMIRIYLSGDAEELLTEVETYFDFDTKRDRDLYDRMHSQRNVRMLERLQAKAREKGGRTRMVAVGAAHLPGKKGMLIRLEQRGYVVWPVASATDIPKSREAALARALAELQRRNAGLSFALRSLEQKVDRLRDRMDKSETRSAGGAVRRPACPPVPPKRRCCPKRIRRCAPRPACR